MVSSFNKTDPHDITEILLKVVLKHHKPTPLTPFKEHFRQFFISKVATLQYNEQPLLDDVPPKICYNVNRIILVYNHSFSPTSLTVIYNQTCFSDPLLS
jgi:hypothetical protein